MERMARLPVVMAVLAVFGVPAVAPAIESAYVPAEGGGSEYLLRVEPDLVRHGLPHPLTSELGGEMRDVRRVRIYVADAWPPNVERAVADAARRPRPTASLTAASLPGGVAPAAVDGTVPRTASHSWPLLIGSLLTLFMSLGANAYLGLLLAGMRQRYHRDLREGLIESDATT